jgi:hypothetical protein
MSLFGYPAKVKHFHAAVDAWGRPGGYIPADKSAKVIEEQKLIKNERGEDIQSIVEIHLEGPQDIGMQDYFEYINGLGKTVQYTVKHIEIKKYLGTDEVKKVIVYG